MAAEDLEESWRRWRRGDASAFDRLYALASPRLAGYCRLLARREDAAADLFQETWRKAFDQAGTFRGESPLAAWLAAIARNLWINQAARLKLERRGLEARGA